jgi:type 1 glutamine amidotransferase
MTRLGKIAIVFTLVLFVFAVAVGPTLSSVAKKNQNVDVLIVTGIDHPAHNWRLTAPALAEVLAKDQRMQVRVVEDPHFLDSSALHRYDVVVLHFMSWEQPTPGTAARKNLRDFVQNGKGLFVLHFGCGAFRDWPEFRNLAGRVWDPKARAHDPRGPFRVNITNVEHPITRGLQSFETEDELYTCLTGDRPIDLLATARSKVDGKDYPMAFVFNYDKGRVFHCALGHDVRAIRNPSAAELFRRGCAWAAGLPPVPKTEEKPPGSK